MSDQILSLTEEEISQAKDKDYMNKEQLCFFKTRLISLFKETEEHIEQVRLELSHEGRESDESDRASQEEERALQLKIIDRENKLLKKIKHSLKQIEDNTYGFCDETGEPIGIQRLLLRPTATMSVDAKSIREEQEKEYSNKSSIDDQK